MLYRGDITNSFTYLFRIACVAGVTVWTLVLYPVAVEAEPLTGNEAGRYDKRYEAPKESKSVIEPVIPDDLNSEEAQAIKFLLAGVRVSGAVVDDARNYELFFDEKVGAKVTLADLSAITDKINQQFISRKSPHLKATIRPQAINNGIVFITIDGGIPVNISIIPSTVWQ